MRFVLPVWFVCVAWASPLIAEDSGVVCEGRYPAHLQGVCLGDDGAIYWSFTDVLVKTDHAGKLVAKVPVASHHGDLCFVDGKVYVAVNLGKFNRPAGEADSWIYVYDANSLAELARHAVGELVHGAGGIAHQDGRFIVVGGLPPGISENYLYEYDGAMKFQKRHVLDSGYTLMGIQTAAFAEGRWWFGCYGTPKQLLQADEHFQLTGKWELDASLGIVAGPDGQILVAGGKCEKAKGCTGHLHKTVADPKMGLRKWE